MEDFHELWRSLLPLGYSRSSGGYRRFAWSKADLACRAWFTAQAADRGLTVRTDRNGNQWAWWGEQLPGKALAIGSHLDSVPDGGAFDGPLGVISSFAAVDVLREQGWAPARPIAIANFADEEGARFGVACAGSRLLTGQLDPERARALTDADGVRLGDAMEAAGHDPDALGPDDALLDRIGQYVELHIEQGRGLVELERAVGVATSIWPHGRWRFDFGGEANHAGTTRLEDRRDPMLSYAFTVLAARKKAAAHGALATFGRIHVEPNGTNAIPSKVSAWLDGRAPSEAALASLLAELEQAARERAERDGASLSVVNESLTPIVEFDHALRDRLAKTLEDAPVLPTGAGHDAGILAARIPTAMLFVRNPSGVSHSPAEQAELADCEVGVHALAAAVRELAGGGL
ncbi:allantoate amidohydrolase [Actinospica durhamensis]|uniref:Allantoate amidohydrolase n=1 Tax=Actinospica durhamensis TaxID=1508375 RepID=A0A941EPF1_9ACTN|nr:allantoate amidohydrolase [Actinospica durhamensis]MBR7834961.1 allantoate amidohydrolase [Actinospica durhamensis]